MTVTVSILLLYFSFYCSFYCISAGKSRLICQTQTIQREEGDDVALQCRLDPPANLVDYTLDVTRADLDKVVHLYRHGKDDSDPQMDQYRDRTTLTHEDLIRGIITLQISSVQLNDSGPYTCYVPDLKANCTIVLRVAKKSNKTSTDDFTTMRPEVTENTKSDNPDAGKVNVGAIVGGVLGVALVLVVLAVVIIGVLVYTGTIKVCKEAHKKTLEPNKYEMERLRPPATGGDEDPHGAAESFLQDV